jgi:molybdopterin converting factor small subunit
MVHLATITVSVCYHNILRQRAGLEKEHLELPEGTDVGDAVRGLAGRHGPGLAEMLLSADGGISPYLVVFLNQQLVFPGRHSLPLADGDELKLFPSISGG